MAFTLENGFVRYTIGADGRNLHFTDTVTGTDWLVREPASRCALVKVKGREHGATAASYTGGRLHLTFGRSGVRVVVRVTGTSHDFVFEVESVDGAADELVFVNIPTRLPVLADQPFSAGTLALNLQTNVEELPGPQRHPWAAAYRRFGLVGARVGLVACPYDQMREALKTMVAAAPGVPHSPLGGPWAMDREEPAGSYLFGVPTAKDVEAWIDFCKAFGFTQIDFCGSLNYGDYQPFPALYPDGYSGVRAVTDRLHAAGILAGLHTMSFSIDKRCAWVTPVPDPRLAKERSYTLATAVGADDPVLPLVESPTDLPRHISYYVRRSMTLQIDDELIEFGAVQDTAPYAVSGCRRGALGTRATAHSAGAPVHHLKECWGCFLPDGDSTLFGEVAGRIATVIHECGFDFTYLDGLDGAHVIGGEENRWHYGTKFAFEVYRRLARPIMMEMATFHHHLWFVRSRMQAWDHTVRGHKRFIDQHVLSNEGCRRIFMPRHLGWSRVLTSLDQEHEATFDDDVEYMWCKGLGTDAGYSLQSISPGMLASEPWLQHVAPTIRTYEELRRQRHFPESVKARLREPGAEFALVRTPGGAWQFEPRQFERHKVTDTEGITSTWCVHNRFSRQPLQLRLEALFSAGPYDAPDNPVLATFERPDEFDDRRPTEIILNSGKLYSYPAAAPGLTAEVCPSTDQVRVGTTSGRWTATNAGSAEAVCSSAPDDGFSLFDHAERVYRPRPASWVRVGKSFTPALDLRQYQALGLWVYGDAQGELINLRPGSAKHFDAHIEHYLVVDFQGWRYVEFVEPETDRFEDYSWPYNRSLYKTYREGCHFAGLETLSLWYNNVPVGRTVTCYLSPIRALPAVRRRIRNPAITVNGRTVVLPVEIETGGYLELLGGTCRLFGPKREPRGEVQPVGPLPTLEPGPNEITFHCDAGALRPRANVTVITAGDTPLRQ